VAYPLQVTEIGKRLSWPALNPQGSPYLLNCRQELQASETEEGNKVNYTIIVCHSYIVYIVTGASLSDPHSDVAYWAYCKYIHMLGVILANLMYIVMTLTISLHIK